MTWIIPPETDTPLRPNYCSRRVWLDLDPVCEDPVGEEEGVEEVDGEEPEVGEPLQQPLRRGVADLGNLAVVQGAAEPEWCHGKWGGNFRSLTALKDNY